MKALIKNRRAFLNAFKLAAAVVPSRTPKPILKNVKITCSAGRPVTLQATDMEIGVVVQVPDVEVLEDGAIVVPVDRFGSIIAESSDNELTLTERECQLEVRGGRNRYRLLLISAAEFPAVETHSSAGDACYEVESAALIQAIRRTSFAAGDDASRYALSGVKFEHVDNSLTLVATDGKCMSYHRVAAIPSSGRRESDAIVLTKSAALVERMFGDAAAPGDAAVVKISVDENRILFASDNATVYSRLVAGRYPRWQQALGQVSRDYKIAVQAGELKTAIRQASIMTNDQSRGVAFTFSDGDMILKSSTAEAGDAFVSLAIDFRGATEFNIDPRFLLDYLRTVSDDAAVNVEFSKPENPAVFSCDEAGQYVVMPIVREAATTPAEKSMRKAAKPAGDASAAGSRA